MKTSLLKIFLIMGLISILLPTIAVAESTTKPIVVASTTQIADFARQVGGDQVIVKSILAPGADPHTYNVTPKDVQIVLEADLCIENGLHLEGKNWMRTLAKDAKKTLITATNGLQPLSINEGGESIPDPHSWFSPRNAAVYVNNIIKGLANLDQKNTAVYQARGKLFLQQLRVLDAWIRAQLNQIPPQRRILVTTHDAFNYFCREFKLNENNDFLSIAPVGWSTGAEVGAGITPERRRKVIQSIKESGAPAIFVETTINPKQIREIAKETGVKIGGELYSDSMGPEGSAGETYIGMMRENTLLIVNALK